MIQIDPNIDAKDLKKGVRRVFNLAAEKVRFLDRSWDNTEGSPVFTVQGKYVSKGWTEWTRGFQFGMPILLFDATADRDFLELGRSRTVELMASHLSHIGVHDHGFNTISTYGNLLRLMSEGRIPENQWEKEYYRLALKVSGAVQAARWTELPEGLGFIHSFNGPHSLFVDTMRSLRILAAAHLLGHHLTGEGDRKISLLRRLLQHAETTSRYNIYFGTGRDGYDIRGRTAHESIFNVKSGSYRCPSSQQGYSPFTTWTRGLSWIITGYAEQLEWLADLPESDFDSLNLPFFEKKSDVLKRFEESAQAAADFYLEHSPVDGIPYWDTGAPGLAGIGNYLSRPADPFNVFEPVDSSAAAIAAQGFLRLGSSLRRRGSGTPMPEADRYTRAGLTIARSLFAPPYLSEAKDHQGLLLHTVYHHPNRWDYIPPGGEVPYGESSMWGDYHLLELAVYLQRMADGGRYPAFFQIE